MADELLLSRELGLAAEEISVLHRAAESLRRRRGS
jgi:hypothetical protein